MKFAQMRQFDVSNGPGIRATLFVSGCTHNCEDCFNKDYQDFKYGNEFNTKDLKKFLEFCEDDRVVGVNILGGEPLQQVMDTKLETTLHLIKVKTGKPIWMWTGYKLEDIANNSNIQPILDNVDVLIDGKFEKDKKDLSLQYRGSSNQRVIDLNYFKETGIIKTIDILK